MLIATKRATELEENKWTDKVFTGDNCKTTAELTFHARQRELQNNDVLAARKKTVDPTVGERLFRTTMRQAAREALRPKNSLEGKVDLTHVRDIRRALRMRYASRTNIEKLFRQYDSEDKGFVSATDIAAMSAYLGIKITGDQAQVLVQSAKENKESDRGLTLEEFQNLIFDSEDKLQVNLAALAPHSNAVASKPPTGHASSVKKEDLGDFKFYLLNL